MKLDREKIGSSGCVAANLKKRTGNLYNVTSQENSASVTKDK
jgi:hypothetical protein